LSDNENDKNEVCSEVGLSSSDKDIEVNAESDGMVGK
jgi:hypothetical protein